MSRSLFSRVTPLKLSSSISRRFLSGLKQDLKDECLKYPSIITLPLQWGQQDPFRHLNNVDWLRFIETGRIDYMYLLTLKMDKDVARAMVDGTGPGFIVKLQSCQYRLPITFPDALTVATKIENLTKDSFTFYTKTFSNRHSKLASESKILCVSYDYSTLSKSVFSEAFLTAVTILEKDPTAIHKLASELPLRKLITM